MIVAELYGKIPSKFDTQEDILTSNVFSFFKYSDRKILLDYLLKLGIVVTLSDVQNAEFLFWQTYDDGTEPDLVIICGQYYLLFEAKFLSDFSPKTKKNDSQIDREIAKGKEAAKNLDKTFVFIALTAEYYKNKDKFSEYENRDFTFIWTNWQFIANFLNEKLDVEFSQNNDFAYDLYSLLQKKRLRSFAGFYSLSIKRKLNLKPVLFYNQKTSKFKGEFTGFINNLSGFKKVMKYKKNFHKYFFINFNKYDNNNSSNIFYNGN